MSAEDFIESAGRRTSDGAHQDRTFEILEALPAYVFLQDANHEIRYANQKFRQLFGDLDGKRCCEVLHGQSRSCDRCPAMEALGTSETFQWEWKDSTGRTFMVFDSAYVDQDGARAVLEVGVEVTGLRKIEQEARQRQEIARVSREHNCREAALGLADEMSEFLASIMTRVESARKFCESDEHELSGILNGVAHQVERAAQTVGHLASYVRSGFISSDAQIECFSSPSAAPK